MGSRSGAVSQRSIKRSPGLLPRLRPFLLAVARPRSVPSFLAVIGVVSRLARPFLAVTGVLPLLAFLSLMVLSSPASAHATGLSDKAAASPYGRDTERLLFKFRDSRITESSGLALSPTQPDILYTHNDSGARPQFFAVGLDGRTRATFTVAGASARDWEGMAVSTDPTTGEGVLWFADIGDNLEGAWPDISVYKVKEPRTMADATLQATRYRFKYEDGGRNAEGVMVNPRTGRLYIVSKEFSGAIYEAPKKLRTDRTNVLRRVGSAPIMATDAAYAPDGSSFVIRTYFSASVYRATGQFVEKVTMPPLDQAESITYTRDGTALLTGTEGVRSPVYRVPLPPEVTNLRTTTKPAATVTATAPAAREAGKAKPGAPHVVAVSDETEDRGVPVSMIVLWVGVAVGAIGIIMIIAYRATR